MRIARSVSSGMLLSLLSLLPACRAGSKEEPSVPPASPQANAVPAPLTTLPAPVASVTAAGADAGPPPEFARPAQPLAPDTTARDGAGYALVAVLRFPEAPGVLRGDTPTATLEGLRRRIEPSFAIDLTPQRTRLVLKGRGFYLPEGTELRLRNDVYGAALVTDGASRYRTLPAGSLRSLFDERRLDVGPLTAAEVSTTGEGARRLAYRTRKAHVWTRAAQATFELGRVQDAGEGGILLCRFLLEWMGAAPQTPLCQEGEVPLHAELRWTPRGSLIFDATSIVRRLDVSASSIATPPPGARFSSDPLAREAGATWLTPAELASLRPGAETGTLLLSNGGDEPRIAWLDGVPFAWVAPGARLEVPGVPRVKVGLEWRTFFDGADRAPMQSLTVPGASEATGADGGT